MSAADDASPIAPARGRRDFLKRSAMLGAATAIAGGAAPNLLLGQAKGANDRLRTAVMGLGRGRGHIKALLDVTNCEIAGVCDVDELRLAGAAKSVDEGQERPAAQVTDFRRLLDDPDIDAITIAAPNFWHAPATILACQAGKHVYVEKPGSHSPWEARRMVEVAEQTGRKVQMGTQRRSYPGMIEGIEKIRDGLIGRPIFARCWYSNQRPSIGTGKQVAPPAELDWQLWQGPVPDRPYKDNLVHYNWHWHWEYGGGEMANNGVHSLDVARWAMGVTVPQRVSYTGGRYHYDDDQETPDTGDALFDFGDCGISWHGSSCHRRKPETLPFVKVYGENGSVDFSSSHYTAYDLDGEEIGQNRENPSDVPHFQNFADAIREGTPLNQPIAEGQASAMLCHLANIAYRTAGAVDVDPRSGDLIDSPDGAALWKRETYREEWAEL